MYQSPTGLDRRRNPDKLRAELLKREISQLQSHLMPLEGRQTVGTGLVTYPRVRGQVGYVGEHRECGLRLYKWPGRDKTVKIRKVRSAILTDACPWKVGKRSG